MEKKKDGFPNEKAIVIPQENLLRIKENPMTRLLHPTDVGYYPCAEGHYRERTEGSPQHILIYCHEGEGWYNIGKGKCTVKRTIFYHRSRYTARICCLYQPSVEHLLDSFHG